MENLLWANLKRLFGKPEPTTVVMNIYTTNTAGSNEISKAVLAELSQMRLR